LGQGKRGSVAVAVPSEFSGDALVVNGCWADDVDCLGAVARVEWNVSEVLVQYCRRALVNGSSIILLYLVDEAMTKTIIILD